MCNIAFENDDQIEVSDIEISRGGCSYTIDTLRSLQSEQRKLFLLCGTDMMLNFDKWKDAEQIFKICYPIYIRRESNFSLNDKIISKNNEYYQKYGVAFRRIVVDPIEISSSEIRNMIKIGKDVSEFVPDRVIDYIKGNNLYVS
jgi:nicotinate-nucleotide adenylyltransferase